ncbi:MAG TPA: RNA-binding cell elongation regulator Jag/EloR [Spirochaetia bacterium]|nr:RNA-binding cell elongation regulator Jag/EloR [Spirochaetia bacterium]
MIQEFEGKTEKDAIDKAIKELALDQEEFDVEIVETPEKRGLFRKGSVRIRVHVNEEDVEALGTPSSSVAPVRSKPNGKPLTADNDLEKTAVEFVESLIEKMGFPGKVSLQFREDRKFGLDITSEHSNILIGKKGKNLDAIQLLVNVFVSKSGRNGTRIIIDAENYRARREESLVRLATRMADQVRRSRGSRLLEPMNPFERRLIHTTLNGFDDIDTQSEGEGLYKQVRVIYRGTEIGPPPQEARSRNGRRPRR